jgi:hypothetical protein
VVLPWQDVLHEGPVPLVSRQELLRLRAGFLSGCGWGERRALFASLRRRDEQYVAAMRAGTPVVVWLEHDLYDQLQLLDALALASAAGGSLELIVVGSFPGRPSFQGLGELTAAELESLWPARREATDQALEIAEQVWAAFRAPNPEELARWAARQLSELPFLAGALRRLLEELPAPQDGLSGTERRALLAIEGGASSPGHAFLTAQRTEDAPFLGDSWFYRTLAALGSGPGRLVETTDGDPLALPPPLGDSRAFSEQSLRLSANGESVLRAERDKVDLVGIDRWVGGTHLRPNRVWRWDASNRALIAPATC